MMKFRALSDTYRRRNPGVRVFYGIPVIPDRVIQRYTEKSGIIFNGIQVNGILLLETLLRDQPIDVQNYSLQHNF